MKTEKLDRTGTWRVIDIVSGYRQALAVLASRRLGVFAELDRAPRRDQALAQALGLDGAALRDLLHVLAALDLLSLDADGVFRLTPDAHCLVPGRPGYVGDALELTEDHVHPAWHGLVHSIRTGEAAPRSGGADDPYAQLYASDGAQESFLAAMDLFATPLARLIADRDLSRYRTVLDVGGARGNLAMIVAQAHPHLHVTVFDLPGLEPAFDRHTAGEDRLAFHAGDFFRDPLPQADVMVLGHVLHNWPLDARRALIRSVAAALNPGGTIMIYDAMLDEDCPPLRNSLASLDMLVWSGGSEYRAVDAIAWLTEAGFHEVERHPHGAGSTLLVGHKP